MAKSNAQLLKDAGDVLRDLGVVAEAPAARSSAKKALSPTVPTTDTLATGQFMDRAVVERLVDLTVSQSGWLSATSVLLRSQRKGEIPQIAINDVVTEGVPENGGKTISTHPDTDHAAYQTKKFQATWYLTVEDLRESRASGEPDFDGKVRRAFAKAMGNDMARASLRGDTSLDSSSRLNRLLRQQDGWLKKIRAHGHRATTTYGSAFDVGVFYALQGMLPEQFRDDPDLRWFMPSLLDTAWSKSLGAYAADGLPFAANALMNRERWTPLGIPQLIAPQLPTDQGFAQLNGTTSVSEDVDDTGSGNITAQCDALLGGYSTANNGRKVKITCIATGQSETRPITSTGGTNIITTVGSLGQSSISETAADYTLDVADTAPIILCNPANLFVVFCSEVRAYRKFEQEAERWRIDVYYEADFGLFNPDAIAMHDGVVVPNFTFGS